MKLSIDHDILRVDNVHFCHVRPGNGRLDLPTGAYPVATTYSHQSAKNLPNASGLGWLGTDDQCDVILVGVRGGTKPVPSLGHLVRLLALLETAEDRGAKVTRVVE